MCRTIAAMSVVGACSGASAWAQSPAPTSRLVLSGMTGVQAAQKVGGLAGGEVEWDLSDRLALVGEATWLQNTATRRRIGTAQTIGAALQQSQGAPTSAALTAPAVFFGGGAQIFLGSDRNFRPYVLAEGGGARVTLRPAFTLSGADVTGQLAQYQVTLGSDLTGSTTSPAFTVGVGVALSRGVWQFDAGLRVTDIRTKGQATNVIRANFGVGRRF